MADEQKKVLTRGARVRVVEGAGFHVGALGVVEFVEPARDRVWVLRDHASSAVWFTASELEVLAAAGESEFERGARAMFDRLVLCASSRDCEPLKVDAAFRPDSEPVLQWLQDALSTVSPASSRVWRDLVSMHDSGVKKGLSQVGLKGDDHAACSRHPKAPHGFLRSASHGSDRYVCECEAWEPYEAGYQAGFDAAYKIIHEEGDGYGER